MRWVYKMSYGVTKEIIKEALEESGLWGSTGLARIALRKEIRSYLTRHPTGRVFYHENWEYRRAWVLQQSSNGTADFKIVTEAEYPNPSFGWQRPAVFNGKSMCKLLSPGNVSGGWSSIFYDISPLPNERVGMEVNFALPYTLSQLQARVNYFAIMRIIRETGTATRAQVELRYNAQQDRLEFGDGVAFHTLLSKIFETNYYTADNFLNWHNAKLIIDFSSGGLGIPIKAYFNEKEFDLSTYSSQGSTAVHTNPIYKYAIFCDNKGGSSTQWWVYLGDIFLTMEEE